MRSAWLLLLAGGCKGILGIDDPVVHETGTDAPKQPIDAGLPNPACPAAPGGCTLFACGGSNDCYYNCGAMPRTWSAANTFCTNTNIGCLATLTSVDEARCIAQATAPMGTNNGVWIGYAQAANGIEPDKGWAYACSQSNYAGWGFTEPNNFNGDEDCAALEDLPAGMFDELCTKQFRFACKLEK